jgi:sugar lactone lactonase YvrE
MYKILPLLLLSLAFATASAQNTVHTYAGTGFAGFVNGDTSVASFNTPRGIALDAAGNLYLCDGLNHCIRKIATDGTVSTYAGTGVAGFADGPAATAQFREPYNLTVDPAGNVFVSDFLNQRIRKIDTTGMVTTIAGTGAIGYQDGPALSAQFNYPRGICLDATGNLYIGDSWSHRIRKIDTQGNVSTYAGGGNVFAVQGTSSFLDGPDTTARFWAPTEVSIDSAGNLYVADAYNQRIRKVDTGRVVSTWAGSGPVGPNAGGFQNGPGNQALFKIPAACYAGPDGSIYVGDGSSYRVRKIDPAQYVSTFAGSGVSGFTNGPDTLAEFSFPRATVLDPARNRLYVVDVNNHAIRYIQIGPTVAAEEPGSMEVEVYPNPFEDRVRVRMHGRSAEVEMKTLNAMGQVVIPQIAWRNGPETELDFSQQVPGIYYLAIRLESGATIVKKVLKF